MKICAERELDLPVFNGSKPRRNQEVEGGRSIKFVSHGEDEASRGALNSLRSESRTSSPVPPDASSSPPSPLEHNF